MTAKIRGWGKPLQQTAPSVRFRTHPKTGWVMVDFYDEAGEVIAAIRWYEHRVETEEAVRKVAIAASVWCEQNPKPERED